MKAIILISSFLAASMLYSVEAVDNPRCKLAPINIPEAWKTMVDPCIKKMKEQVQVEINAAMTYLAMGAHFSRDNVNRPGFAKMFFESASEERQHAIKIMEYLILRGELNQTSELINDPHPIETEWENGVKALESALKLETSVTQKIKSIIVTCEKPDENGELENDYHLVDYLTGDFLEEQYQGQKDLANKISTLGKMMRSHGVIGEWLFDKKLLKGELL